MGCCLSTNATARPSKPTHISDSNSNSAKSQPPPPHPISEEEEAVKEVVLSETLTIPKQYPTVQQNLSTESFFIKSEPPLPDFSMAQNVGVGIGNQPSTPFSNDDPSEICSNLSEGASISTAVTESKESHSALQRRSAARSKSRPTSGEVKRDRTVGISPGRRSEISPNRSGSGYGRKRDSGEISGRRSRSPATRTKAAGETGLGRIHSTRKTGRSPGRAGPERIRKVEEGSDNEWPLPAPTRNESLENPLVSLECFIFL